MTKPEDKAPRDEEGKLETQCWICPYCFDDHDMRDCLPCDLKSIIDRSRVENDRLKKELFAAKSNVDHFQKELERVKIDYETANDGLHAARKAIKASSEDVCVDITHLVEEHDDLKAKIAELISACVILKDDADFFTGDVRKLSAWERFTLALAEFEKES